MPAAKPIGPCTPVGPEQCIEAYVTGPDNANRFFVCTGMLSFTFQGTSQKYYDDEGLVTFEAGPVFTRNQVKKVIATVSLNDIRNAGEAKNAGWRVKEVEAAWNETQGRIVVKSWLNVSDTDGYIMGLAYHVFVLATM
ncbi:MAG TPA: hypothetical protein DEP53_10315 [Bacteroidetes bacterium]|nr:hypothetical protein [Bacteroidota bacterium]